MFWMRAQPTAGTSSGQQEGCGHGIDESHRTDEALVAAARQDRRAFGALYDRYLGPIYRYCYVRLGTREEAEDVTGEVFMKALTELPRYRGDGFAAWLYRIAHNAVVDVYRRRRPVAPLEQAEEAADLGPTPEEAALAQTTAQVQRQALDAALAALTAEQRAVIELRLARWSTEQIATTLHKSPAGVKMLRLRAVARLRSLLAGLDDQEDRRPMKRGSAQRRLPREQCIRGDASRTGTGDGDEGEVRDGR